jgi:hypothetical protein
MRARGDGYLRGTSKNLTTGGTEAHRGKSNGCCRFPPCSPCVTSVPPVVAPFDDSNSKFAQRCDLRRQSPPAREEERHHRRSRRRAETSPHRPSRGRQSQRRLYRILREAFEPAPFLRYYCSRPDQPEQSDSCFGSGSPASTRPPRQLIAGEGARATRSLRSKA